MEEDFRNIYFSRPLNLKEAEEILVYIAINLPADITYKLTFNKKTIIDEMKSSKSLKAIIFDIDITDGKLIRKGRNITYPFNFIKDNKTDHKKRKNIVSLHLDIPHYNPIINNIPLKEFMLVKDIRELIEDYYTEEEQLKETHSDKKQF
jgi:hypothetical protein